MHTTPKRSPALALAALALTALPVAAPVAAHAATPAYRLGGQPQIRDVHDGVGTMHITANRLPVRNGRVQISVQMYGGKRVGTVKAVGTHSTDITYEAKVSGGVKAGSKYTVRFRLAGGRQISETAKAYAD